MSGLPVLAQGAVTSLAYTTRASWLAMRCGYDNFVRTEFIGERGQPVVGAELLFEDEVDLRGEGKKARMLALAVEQALVDADAYQIPLILCLPSQRRPCYFAESENQLFLQLCEKLNTGFNENSRIVLADQTGICAALDLAQKLVSEGMNQVMIAGVDSYLSAASISHYSQHERLYKQGYGNGFLPGEAAAAVLLGHANPDQQPAIRVSGWGRGVEPIPRKKAARSRADGMVEAYRNATAAAGISMDDVDSRFGNLSGEEHTFKEAALALTRTVTRTRPDHPLLTLGDHFGETGAAAGPLILALASEAAQTQGHLPGQCMLGFLSNDDSQRVAFILQKESANG